MSTAVGVVSSHGLVAIHKRESIEQGYNVMKRIATRHVPVVDDDGTIIGILSDRDFQRAMKVPVERLWSVLDLKPEFCENALVMEYMSWPIQTVDESTSLTQAAEQMIENKISSLIVTRKKKAIGIVTTEDLLKALIKPEQESLVSLKDNLTASIYNSPVGNIAQMLANIGI